MPQDQTPDPSDFTSLGAKPTDQVADPVASQPEPTTPAAPESPAPDAVPQAAQPPVEQPEPEASPWQELGVQSEEEAIQRLRELEQWRQQNEPYANYGRQLAPQAKSINEYLSQQHQQGQPAQQPEPDSDVPEWKKHETEFWKKPDYDPTWERLVEMGPNGRFVGISPDVPPHIVQGVNEYKDWQRKKLEQIVDNPIELFRNGAQPWLKDFVQNQVNELIQQQMYEQEMQSIERDLAAVVYEMDPVTGTPQIDPQTGEFALSDYGRMLVPHLEHGRQLGITAPSELRRYAEGMVAAELWQYQQQQQAQDSSVSSSTDAAGNAPSEPAAPAQPQATQPPVAATPQESFLQKAKKQASHTQSRGGAGQQPITPEADGVSVESDDFFSAAAAAQGHS